jgi:hypothetical protein
LVPETITVSANARSSAASSELSTITTCSGDDVVARAVRTASAASAAER